MTALQMMMNLCASQQQEGVITRVTQLARNVEISFQSRTGTPFSVRLKRKSAET